MSVPFIFHSKAVLLNSDSYRSALRTIAEKQSTCTQRQPQRTNDIICQQDHENSPLLARQPFLGAEIMGDIQKQVLNFQDTRSLQTPRTPSEAEKFLGYILEIKGACK